MNTRGLLSHGLGLALAACGGQSLSNGQGSQGGGNAGSGATGAQGGASHAGAAPGSGGIGLAGISGVGFAGTGGIGFAGTGGIGFAGTGQGGGSSGTVSTGGSGALAGHGGATSDACTLPLETGPCDAAFTRYGFNPKTQRCEPFTYGGCQGNANNFETFDACTTACGLAVETGCPGGMPDNGLACSGPAHPCDYSGVGRCLCQPVLQDSCQQIVSSSSCSSTLESRSPPAEGGASGECTEPGCIEQVVVISYYTCTCDSTWSCVVGAASGGR